MKNNVEVLKRIGKNLDDARNELELINKEERLLEWPETTIPLLQQMFLAKDPYDKLWNNALNFTIKSEEWLNGNLIH